MNDALLSSKSQDWATPPDFFAALHARFAFTLDAAASAENAKCAHYFTPEQDGLSQNWGGSASGVIRHTGARSASGCARGTKKPRSRAPLLSCCCRPGRTRPGITTTAPGESSGTCAAV